MSECRICRDHGFSGIMITWDNNIKTKSGRFVPLELDKITPHKHYEPGTITGNGNNSSNPTPAAARGINEINNKAGAEWVRSILSGDNKQEDELLEALSLEFKMLLKHVLEYLKANQNG